MTCLGFLLRWGSQLSTHLFIFVAFELSHGITAMHSFWNQLSEPDKSSLIPTVGLETVVSDCLQRTVDIPKGFRICLTSTCVGFSYAFARTKKMGTGGADKKNINIKIKRGD